MPKVPANIASNSYQYWANRALLLKLYELQSSEQYERELYKRLDSLEKSFENDIKQFYRRYANNNAIDPDVAEKLLKNINTKNFDNTLEQFKAKAIQGGYQKELDDEYFKMQIARLQDLKAQLEQRAGRLATSEDIEAQGELSKRFEDTYNRTIYNIQQQGGYLNTNFARFNDNMVKAVLNQSWGADGKVFSERIWHNYRETLPSQLTDSLLRSTIKGDSYTKVIGDFRQRYTDVKRKHIHRLVVTEMGHVAETATGDAYEEEELDQYEYMATLERKTCDICSRLDGRKFKVSSRKPGLNYPLIHPWCRCTTVAYFGMKPSSRYDQENAQRVRNMSYKTWKKKMDEGSLEPYTEPKRRNKPNPNPEVKKPVDKVKEPTPVVKQPEPVKTSNDPFAKYRPKFDTSFDFKNATNKQLIDYIEKNSGGMKVVNGPTKSAPMNRAAVENIAETVGMMKDMLQAMPDTIPEIQSQGPGKMRRAIASYGHWPDDLKPAYLRINMRYYKSESVIQDVVKRSMEVSWSSHDSDIHHTLKHELGHHFNYQLRKMYNGDKWFEEEMFEDILANNGRNVKNYVKEIGDYASYSFKSSGYLEPFAELFAEAYGPEPRPIAIEFKKEFEKRMLEVMKNAKRT